MIESNKPTEFRNHDLKRWGFIFVFLIVAFSIWTFKSELQTNIFAFQKYANNNPIESAVYFILFYSSVVPFSFPPIIMNALGAFLFDFQIAVVLNISGALSSGIVSFYYGKFFLKAEDSDSFFETIKVKFPFLNRNIEWVEVMMIRSVMIPFTLVSYSFGVLGVKNKHFIFGTLIGIIPGTAINTYFLGESVSLVLQGNYQNIHLWTSIGISFFLVGTIAFFRFLLIRWIIKRKSGNEILNR